VIDDSLAGEAKLAFDESLPAAATTITPAACRSLTASFIMAE
jgi:hypothetical protein